MIDRVNTAATVFLGLTAACEPIEINDASLLRVSLHQSGGRFRLSSAEDDYVRSLLLPAQPKLWSSIGPFPAEDAAKAYATAFDPEKDVKAEPLDLKKSYPRPAPAPAKAGDAAATAPAPKPAGEPKPADKDVKPILKAAEFADDGPPAKAPAKDAADKPEAKAAPKPPAEKITWAEQRTWRDGTPARLNGGGGAYYLTRKVVSTRPRTAVVQIDGPAGFKVWVNGELVQAAAPRAPPPPAPKKEAKPGDDEPPPPDEVDIEAIVAGRDRPRTEKKFRIGLREGENEVVVKAVLAATAGPRGGAVVGGPPGTAGPGGTFQFNLTPEGDDAINHEVATAIRRDAEERAAAAAVGPLAYFDPPVRGVPGPGGTQPAAMPMKVGTAGEQAAPTRDEDDDAGLLPADRRQKALREFYRTRIDPVGRLLGEELARLKDEERELKRQMPETLVMEEPEKPRPAFVFVRGLYKSRGEAVTPGTPVALPPMGTGLPPNRLGLARWLVSGHHPLTARVLVNRIWQQYFGLGLVRTAEDFGVRGELPTHPELLDYLATELADGGWDLKKFHKRLVLSATYRQAATAAAAKFDRDPENRLLARGPRLRLTAEMVRDNALSVSGLLHEKVGGESVRPPQPKDAGKTADGFDPGYRRDRGERQYRRGLYVFRKRGSPYPSMLNFDAAPRDTCTVTRATTTTPLQALTLLNDPVYVEAAKMLGQRMMKDREAVGRAKGLDRAEEDGRRLAYGFRLCTSRPPTDKERGVLRRLLADQRAHYTAEAAAAGHPDVAARTHSYEMAARLQTSVPELADLSKEPADVLERYGAEPGKESFANNCLLARRLAERGVRFVQLMDGGWDHHFNIPVVLR